MKYVVPMVVLVAGCGRVVDSTPDGPPAAVDPVVTVTRSGTGEGNVTSSGGEIACGETCSASVPPGTSVTLTATPADLSTFLGWSGACSGTAECVVTVDEDVTITAEFVGNALTVDKAGTGTGKVSSSIAGIDCGEDCTEAYPNGTEITLTAVPGAGSVFTGWEGACTGTDDCVLTTDGAQTVTAVFTCSGARTFNYTGSLQSFTPPACATQLIIDAAGAQGGNGGGRGARIIGTFPVMGPLGVLVGGQGQTMTTGSSNGGGGGGTFVFVNITDPTPLIAAGGGGGRSVGGMPGPGSDTTAPTNSIGAAGNALGGANGSGGQGGVLTGAPGTPGTGGGGAGWIGNGAPGTVASAGGGGRAPRLNGAGGAAGNLGAAGGYGGGGGSAGNAGASGGGGGYNGGGGGHGWNGAAWGSGGGGGSFNGGANPMAMAGVREGHGTVTITWK